MQLRRTRRTRFHLHTALRAHRRVGLSTDNWGWYWVQLMGTLLPPPSPWRRENCTHKFLQVQLLSCPPPPASIMQRGQAKFITTEPALPNGQRSTLWVFGPFCDCVCSSSASLRSYYFGLQGVFGSHFWTESSVPDDPPKCSNSIKHIE